MGSKTYLLYYKGKREEREKGRERDRNRVTIRAEKGTMREGRGGQKVYFLK